MNGRTMRIHPCSILLVVALGSCSGATSTPAVDRATPDRLATSVARWAAPTHKDLRRPWISSDIARAKTLLFVSDSGTADVYIYQLPSLKLAGTITGFSQPQGECSDNKGNVWVTDTNAQTIYELSHHGRLENELSDTTGYPAACAWDATTGDLAVMNLFGLASTTGEVLIYPSGSKSPTSFQNASQYYYNFGGYDASGNLFFDGRDDSGNFMLSELSRGSSSAHTITLTAGTIYFPGMVQWDSKRHDLIVGDQSCGNVYSSCLYSVNIGKTGGTIDGSTDLSGSAGGAVCDLVQGVQFNNQIAGSDNDFCGSTLSATYLWPYPAGGTPTSYNNATDSTPVGAAISK
jgi:hypothetical protein